MPNPILDAFMSARQFLPPPLRMGAHLLRPQDAYKAGQRVSQIGQMVEQAQKKLSKLPEIPEQLLTSPIGMQFAAGFAGVDESALTPENMAMATKIAKHQFGKQRELAMKKEPEVEPEPEEEPVVETGGKGIPNWITQLLIPAATAGIGMAVPDALAGAAGFQTGYSGEMLRQRKRTEEKEDKKLDTAKKFAEIQETLANIEKIRRGEVTDLVKTYELFKENRGLLQKFLGISTKEMKDIEEELKNRAKGITPAQTTNKITEANIQFTMKQHGISRASLLDQLGITEKDIIK